MKNILLLIAVAVILISSSSIYAQTEEIPSIPDSVMKTVVERVVRYYYKAPAKPRRIYFSDKGISREWLPTIENIEFVFLTDKEAKETKVYFFQSLRGKNGRYSIDFGYGDPNCGATGDEWEFRIKGDRVRLWRFPAARGWGMGCGRAVASSTTVSN